MIGATSCPDVREYERLRLGELPPAEAERLVQHLEQCDRCLAVVGTLGSEDTLVRLMRSQATAIDHSEQDLVEGLRQRLRTLRPQAQDCAADHQEAGHPSRQPAGVSSGAEATEVNFDFLAPAQGPDELGWLGPYRVLKVLGVGGMGIVFQAEDLHLERLVALKVMLPSLAVAASARQRFLREARAAAAIDHDHIVHIYQVGEDRGVPFLAMQFLHGESLDERLKREQPLSLAEVLRIGREAALGLAAAHERGLIHRDIKPANIWLEGNRARVKILDFGLARAVADNAQLTQQGAIIGTPAYIAPEQASGQGTDGRCDLFSLGCVLYYLCTGKPPFEGTDTVSTLLAVAMNNPRPPIALRPELPAALSKLVMKLLAKQPEERPETAQAVAVALEDIEDQTGVGTTRKEPAGTRARRSGNKRTPWAWLVGIGVLGLGLLAAAVIVLWPTPGGTVRIETNDPGVEIIFDKSGATIKGADKEAITLRPGVHGVLVKRGDFEFEADKLVLGKGESVKLRVELLEGKMQLLKDGKLIGSRELPLDPKFTNRIGMEFVLVPKGKFRMGGGGGHVGERDVVIPHDFYLGKHEVTQEQWNKVTGINPSHFSRQGGGKAAVKDIPEADLKRAPVENVSWNDAQLFVAALNAREKESGWVYRLPKETEWEYGCRGGPLANVFEYGFDFYLEKPANQLLAGQANFEHGKGLKRPVPGGTFKPNRLGLHDMHGNVWEWCDDTVPADDPKAPYRVMRGGSWDLQGENCSASIRRFFVPSTRFSFLGLRLARVPAREGSKSK